MSGRAAMSCAWVDPGWTGNPALADYPASMACDSVRGCLAQAGYSLDTVTPAALEAVLPKVSTLLFSATTCQWPTVCEIAARVRDHHEGHRLIVGGVHVSAIPDDAGSDLFDRVVVGEAETVISDLLDDLSDSSVRSRRGSTGPRVVRSTRGADPEVFPRPVRRTEDVRGARLRGLMFPAPSKQFGAAALLLSRGCNHSCSFCASHVVWGPRLRRRGIEGTITEVGSLTNDFGANVLVLVDQALGEDVQWTREVCTRLSAHERGPRWYCMSRPDIDRSLLSDMARGGCTKIGVGVETADAEWRHVLGRPDGGELEQLNELFRACNEVGILVKAYFIVGFPWETQRYLLETTRRFLDALEANELKITFFTPFPGTLDWKRYSNQLLTRDWRYFDTECIPVVRNPRIDPDEYRAIREELLRSFYASPTYTRTWRRFVSRFPEYQPSWDEFAGFLLNHRQVSGQEEWVRHCRQGRAPHAIAAVAAMG